MLELLMNGGWMMLPLLVCSMLGVAVIIDRIRAFRSASADVEGLRKEVRACLGRGDVAAALEAATARKGPVAEVIAHGLNRLARALNNGRAVDVATAAALKSMEDAAPSKTGPLEKRLNLLVLVAAAAPLLGMTGTVTGMIASFDSMASSAGLDPGAVAGGIGEALITTAAGLLVALPCAVAYNLFTRRVEEIVSAMEAAMTDISDTMGDI